MTKEEIKQLIKLGNALDQLMLNIQNIEERIIILFKKLEKLKKSLGGKK